MIKTNENLNDNYIKSHFKNLIKEDRYNLFFYDLLFKDKITRTIFVDNSNLQVIVIDSILVRNVYNNSIEQKVRIEFLNVVYYFSKSEFLKLDYENFINKYFLDFKEYYLKQNQRNIYLQEKFI